jgi:ubiquinone/menaquinone biosynthesis C-methylase UbiE
LDVGVGSGTYVMAFLEASPTLRATLFDLPPVIEMAHSRLEAAGLISRVDLVAGDYNRDDLPPGHDLALLSAIIHQNSPDQNEALYRKIYKALEPGGRLVIRDHVMKPDRTAPKAGALFAVKMLAATPGGGTFTLAEIETGLRSAGFDHIRQLREGPAMDCLVEAIKPE